MATNAHNTPMRGRIPASAISTTRLYPIDLIAADPIPGLARRAMMPLPACEAAEQAAAMNAVLVGLNAILADGGAHA